MINNLRKYRLRKNLTQFELAKLTNISPSDLSAIENGKKWPFPGWRRRICEVLGADETKVFPCVFSRGEEACCN